MLLTVSGDRNSDKIKTIKQGSGESKFSKVSVKAKHDDVVSMIKDKVKAETAARNDVVVHPTNSNAYNEFETVHEDRGAISKSDVEIITSEAQTKKKGNHGENENQLRNELFGDSMSQKNEVAGDDDDDDDMPVLQPLQPQFSEVLRSSVLVREPDDLSVTQEVDSTVPSTTRSDKEFRADGNA